MFKKATQRGRSERGGDAYSLPCVKPLSHASTKLADCFNILLFTRRLRPRVVILHANDIFFAQQIAFLHLNHDEGMRPRILESMERPHRDHSRVERRQIEYFFPHKDPGSPRDNNPVLGPMMVKLQAEPMSGPHLDKLHFISDSLI